MKALLADTGPLYALLDPDDQYHLRAVEELERISRSGRTLLAAYPTLLETYTLILRRLGVSVAHRWLADIRSGVGLISPTSQDYENAAQSLTLYSDQSISWFDALVAVLAHELAIQVWSFDHHFDVLRADVWR